MAISIDLSGFKSAGVYTVEIDNTARDNDATTLPYRLVVGFSNKGPFNRPVLLRDDKERATVFGDIDAKLEHKGCFFNRALKTSLTAGPVLALNLLKTDDSVNGRDQVNWAAMSLDSGAKNPTVKAVSSKYGEYDYTLKKNIPFVGQTPFATLYNRSRFWIPDKDLLNAVAASNFTSNDSATFEQSNLFNFANVGTEEFSVLVFKPKNVTGYDVTAEQWYGSKDNIPYGWIRPYDMISDYFIQVVCVKGNWTNYPVLSINPIWSEYFDKNGIKKNKIDNFMYADGVSIIGSWSGVIIPDFIDKQGNLLSIERKINAVTEKTGLLVSFNKDALSVLNWDLSGADIDPDQGEIGNAVCGLDIDGNNEITSAQGEAETTYQVDMVGHNAFRDTSVYAWSYDAEALTSSIAANTSVYNEDGEEIYTMPAVNTYRIAETNGTIKIGAGAADSSTGTFIDVSIFNIGAGVDMDKLSGALSQYYVLTEESKTAYNIEMIGKPEYTVNGDDASISAIVICNNQRAKVTADASLSGAKVTNIKNVKVFNGKFEKSEGEDKNGINFLSYSYTGVDNDGVVESVSAAYLNSSTLWAGAAPVADDILNIAILTNKDQTDDSFVKVGDYLNNIAYKNEDGIAVKYNIIPGLTKVTKKQFLQVEKSTGNVTYKGKQYRLVDPSSVAYTTTNGNYGFYIVTTTAPIQIVDAKATRQVAISDDRISGILRFIPLKGLEITSRHRPGFDAEGNLGIEAGIEKIYSVLEDEGIKRGLLNRNLHDFRYIVDTMSYGIGAELGGKVYLSRLAKSRGKCLAVLNLPSAKQFAVSSNPYFCDTYIPGVNIRPALNTKYIAEGGNTEMGSTVLFNLPSLDNGADFTACFFPHLIYQENGREFPVPPAADACNVLYRKFTGVADRYGICANNSGILSNNYIKKLEYEADQSDRDELEPFGVNAIINQSGAIMIYGNQTAFQEIKSDRNKLHVRENLNTLEIECDAICKKFNFLYNTPAVRAELVSKITNVCQIMQISGAIESYIITCDETNNTREVIENDACIVDVEVVMSHGLEKIIQRFTLNRRSED